MELTADSISSSWVTKKTAPYFEGWAEKAEEKEEKHMALIGAHSQAIVSFLAGETRDRISDFSSKQREVGEQDSPNLSIWCSGSIRLLANDEALNSSGINPATGSHGDAIPGSSSKFSSRSGAVHIEDPATGTYMVTYYGDLPKDFRIVITYNDENGVVQLVRLGYRSDFPTSFSLALDASSEPPISITPAVLEPTELSTQPCPGIGDAIVTCLSWTAPEDPAVTGYALYAFLEGDSLFTHVDNVDSGTTPFQSEFPWSADDETSVRAFAVTAHNAAGTESFFSNVVLNNDRDSDGMTDADETAAGTSINNPDSDEDGLSDGDEITWGANPLVGDTDGDGYKDGDEVLGKSDPVDDQYIPLIYIDKEGLCSGKSICRSSIPAGIDTAGPVGYIAMQEGAFAENIILNDNKNLTIVGGYDETFENRGAVTSVSFLEITNGSIVVSDISVQ